MGRWRATVLALATSLVAAGVAGCSSGSTDAAGGKARKGTTSAGPGSTKPGGDDRTGSEGCRGKALAAGRSEVTVRSGGRDRTYLRYVPSGLTAKAPAPLVVDLTAYSPATLQESFSGFTKPNRDGSVKADEVGAVVVMPEPVNGKGLLTWNVDDADGWTDDQRYVTDLLDDIAADACIAPDRTLVMGFAIGAVMASTIACEQPERVTVLATVSGLWDPPGCRPERPIPVVSIHGTGDHFLPFDGGVGDRVGRLGLSGETSAGLVAMASRPGAREASNAWAIRNGCASSDPGEAPDGAGAQRLSWSGCDADVELHVIDGGSHTWPGSNGMAAYEGLLGPVSLAIDANDVIWTFFEAHAPA